MTVERFDLDDERPIPLGRARAGAAVGRAAESAGANRGPLTDGCGFAEPAPAQPPSTDEHRVVAPPPPLQPAPTAAPPHIERTSPEPRPDDGGGAQVAVLTLPERGAEVVEAAVGEPPAPAVVPDVAAPIQPAGHAPGAHPMAGLRRLRMEARLVEPVHRPWRRVLRNFAIAYVVVIGSVLGLIAAFLALTGNAGSAHP